jgi:hypothetical protein
MLMPRDLPPYRFELRYPSDGLDEEDDKRSEEWGAPPASGKVLRAQTTEGARPEAAHRGEADHAAGAISRYAGWRGDLGERPTYRVQQRGFVKLTFGVASIPYLSPKQLKGALHGVAHACCSTTKNHQGYAPR